MSCFLTRSFDIVIALGQRIVLLRTAPSTTPDQSPPNANQSPRFFTPVVAPESITAVAWLCPPQPAATTPVRTTLPTTRTSTTSSSSTTTSNAHSDGCLLVGTSDGFLQLHDADGVLLHRQELHDTPVLHIFVRESGSSIDPEDASQDVTITFRDAVVRMPSFDLLAVSARHHRSKQREGIGGGASLAQQGLVGLYSVHPLAPLKWELKGVGPRTGAACVGPAPTSLYAVLAGRRETPRLMLFTVGSNPPCASFNVDESSTAGVLSLVGSLASTSASALVGKAKGYLPSVLGGGGKADRSNNASHGFSKKTAGEYDGHGGAMKSRPGTPDADHHGRMSATKKRERLAGTPAAKEASVWDGQRRITSMTLSPCCRWAACCDNLGRVMIVDVVSCTVLRILKGYRDAQTVWMVQPPQTPTDTNKASRQCDVSTKPHVEQNNERTARAPDGDDDSSSSHADEEARTTEAAKVRGETVVRTNATTTGSVLMVYAPRRCTVEAWQCNGQSRLGVISGAPRRGILLAQPATAIAAAGTAAWTATHGDQGGYRRHHRSNACWLLDLEKLEMKELTSALLELLLL